MTHDPAKPCRLAQRIAVAMGLAVTLMMVNVNTTHASDITRITLRSVVELQPGGFTLGHIATIEGPQSNALNDLIIHEPAENASPIKLRLNALSIRKQLQQASVNLSVVSFGGARQVTVHFIAHDQTQHDPDSDETFTRQTTAAEPATDRKANPLPSLYETDDDVPAPRADASMFEKAVEKWLHDRIEINHEDLRLSYHESDLKQLQRSIEGLRLEYEPNSSTLLGRVPMTIRLYDGEQLLDTVRIAPHLRIQVRTFIARHEINRQRILTEDDLVVQAMWIDTHPGRLADDVAQLVGYAAARTIRPGEIVDLDHVEPPVLVRRGQLVTVRCVSGAVVVKTIARAEEAGSMNQIIRVRHPHTRESYLATVTGEQQVMVRVNAPAENPATESNTSLAGATP